jgi:hypothetical protein
MEDLWKKICIETLAIVKNRLSISYIMSIIGMFPNTRIEGLDKIDIVLWNDALPSQLFIMN